MKLSIFVFVFALLASIVSAKNVGEGCSVDDDCDDDRLECVFETTGGTEPSVGPTGETEQPGPTDEPEPTVGPTDEPEPTGGPTDEPEPTGGPTDEPEPTGGPTDEPEPTGGPTDEPEPTSGPTTATPGPATTEKSAVKSRGKRDLAFNLGKLARYFKSLSADKGTCQCKSDFELTNDKKKCRIPITVEDEYACEEDYDCEVIGAMPVNGYDKPKNGPKCEDKVCQCGTKDEEEDWFVAEYLDDFVCIHQIQNFTCRIEQECSWLNSKDGNTTASCTGENICECNDADDSVAFWPSEDNPQKCQRVLGGSCTKDEQCSHIDDASCSDNECSCDKNYKADSDNELFACKKKSSGSGASTVLSSILLLISSVWLGRWNS